MNPRDTDKLILGILFDRRYKGNLFFAWGCSVPHSSINDGISSFSQPDQNSPYQRHTFSADKDPPMRTYVFSIVCMPAKLHLQRENFPRLFAAVTWATLIFLFIFTYSGRIPCFGYLNHSIFLCPRKYPRLKF